MVWWILLALGAAYVGHGNLALSGAAFAGGAIVCYVVSVHRHPRRVCRSCNGTGRHRGAMFFWADRACTTCAGGSRHRRWGAQALRGESGQRVWAEQQAQKARGRRGAPR